MKTKTIQLGKLHSRFSLKGILIGLVIGMFFYLGLVYLDMRQKYNSVDASTGMTGQQKVNMAVGSITTARSYLKGQTARNIRITKRSTNVGHNAGIRGTRTGGYINYIQSLKLEKGLNDWLLRVIWCESRGNPKSVNNQEVIVGGVSYGHATGLGQFLPSTWKRGETKYLKRTADIWNEYDQVDMMIAFYKNNRQSEWVCK